jgi:hypothetical protein
MPTPWKHPASVNEGLGERELRAGPRRFWASCLLVVGSWALVSALGCEEKKPPPAIIEDSSPSPNASIYPSPLISAASPDGPPAPTTTTATATPVAKAARDGRPAKTTGRLAAAPVQPAPGLASSARHHEANGGAVGQGTFLNLPTPRAAASLQQTPVPVPVAVRPDEVLAADLSNGKDSLGVSLVGEWRWNEPAGPPARPEVNGEAIASLKKQLALRWNILASESGRLRIRFDSRAFPVPAGSELRARADHLGHLFVFPSGLEYRLALPGSLRSLFSDRRLDVTPLVLATEPKPRVPQPNRFSQPVERAEIPSRIGTLTIDFAHVPEAGVGALLLCRTLLELTALDPRGEVCAREWLPVRAQFVWQAGPGLVFEITELRKRTDLPLAELLVPPPGSALRDTALPAAPTGLLVSREEAATFRTRPIETPQPQLGSGAPPDGLWLRNGTEVVRYALVDGVPVAFVAPGSEQAVTGFLRGRYNVQWRTFFADNLEPVLAADLPARLAVGEREPVEMGPPPLPSASAAPK